MPPTVKSNSTDLREQVKCGPPGACRQGLHLKLPLGLVSQGACTWGDYSGLHVFWCTENKARVSLFVELFLKRAFTLHLKNMKYSHRWHSALLSIIHV